MCWAVEKDRHERCIVEAGPELTPNHPQICHARFEFPHDFRAVEGDASPFTRVGSGPSAVKPFLKDEVAASGPILRSNGGTPCSGSVSMSPDALNSLFSLCIGFALAGALASGYQALVQRPLGFGLLGEGVAPKTFAAVPFLVFAAPFIIMRNTLRGARIERPPLRIRDDGDRAGRDLELDVGHVFS